MLGVALEGAGKKGHRLRLQQQHVPQRQGLGGEGGREGGREGAGEEAEEGEGLEGQGTEAGEGVSKSEEDEAVYLCQ
jgi:hypothetical protein